MENYKKPNEIIEYTINGAIAKVNKSFLSLVLLGFLGGAFIAFGAVGNIIAGATLRNIDVSLAKVVGASVFPVGLIMIVILGAELFTSNCLISVAVMDKKTSVIKMLRNWVIVYFSNLMGSLFVASISVKTSSFGSAGLSYLEDIALHKVHATGTDIFLKGILCNMLVCGGVLLAYASKDIISKIFGIWFPIMLFIILGYDHCIANMLYLPSAIMAGFDLSVADAAFNIFFATLGNMVGGVMMMGAFLYRAHYSKNNG